MPFVRSDVAKKIASLAENGVYLGTSSWKYAGWRGSLYDEQRYIWRGKFAESRFEKYCLTEYAEVFKTVCVDAAYYAFPTEKYLDGLASLVPPDFQFAFKVTDDVTLKRFPNIPRFATRGQVNANFLNPDVFARSFLAPCESIRPRVGLMIFEFSRFHTTDYATGTEFLADLDRFLGALPKGWSYGVEIRNKLWLRPDYFACLERHGVTHVFNSWQAMPPINEQMEMPGSRTNPAVVAARLLLKPGRDYESAVKFFSPYDRVKEEYAEARIAAQSLIAESLQFNPRRRTYIYVNNRLEGNALETIAAILDAILRAGIPDAGCGIPDPGRLNPG